MRHPIIEEDLRAIAAADLPWSAFQDRCVVISGANGFLPAYMVETLLYLNERSPRQKTRVVGLVRNLPRAAKRFKAYAGRPDFELLAHDVTQPLPAVPRGDFVVHAAGQASPKYFGSDPVGTLSANVLGTHHLLALARQSRAEGFLFFSSGEVYGEPLPGKKMMAETDVGIVDHMDVRSCYAESKRLGETMCLCWRRQFGVPVKILRIGHTYGPGMRLDDGRVFADFVADLVHRRPIVMKSDGSARRAFCYLADAVRGYFTVLLKGPAGEAYNVANTEAQCTILELAELLAGLFPDRRVTVVRQARDPADTYMPCKIRQAMLDISKVKALGWRPTTTLAEGFRRTVESFLP
ncbi:MAG: NAD-dependent epimerase/dehydratase family protein [Thermoguttaceae bacterium]|jgi:nucleoside-diphosphate-sugar epimerase